jgi:ribosomal protein S13
MARISGVDIPREKRLEIALTYIFGIGKPTAQRICGDTDLDPNQRVRDLTEDEVNKIVTARACRCVVSEPTPMPEPARARRRPSPTRRRQ